MFDPVCLSAGKASGKDAPNRQVDALTPNIRLGFNIVPHTSLFVKSISDNGERIS